MTKLYLDTETRSATDIKNGLDNYFADPYFDILMVQWAVNNKPVQVWDIANGQPQPRKLKRLLKKKDVMVVMHNSGFDRRALKVGGIADIPLNRTIDTMIQAHAHGLPGKLETLSQIFGLDKTGDGKLAVGRRLIRKFCVPRKPTKEEKKTLEPGHAPLFEECAGPDYDMFKDYGGMDVHSMRILHKRIPTINYPDGYEYTLWQYDQRMNQLGIKVDKRMATKAVEEFEKAKIAIKRKTVKTTNNEVQSPTQVAETLKFLNDVCGLWLPNLQKRTVERALDDPDVPEAAKEILRQRQDISASTPTKYSAVLKHVGKGNRLRNTIQFLGASRTGRDAGRVFQPQNLMRPNRWKHLEKAEPIVVERAIEDDVQALLNGSAALMEDDIIDFLSNLIRSVIISPKGKKLVDADLSNIEGRTLVWLACEAWKVKYFRRYDAGKIKYDNYVMAYSRAMNVPPEKVDGYMRAIGKVMELGLGYGGGVGAFLQFAKVYKLDIKELAKNVRKTAEDRAAYDKAYTTSFDYAKENGRTYGLSRREFAACEYLKVKWREAHPNVVALWKNLERTFKRAIQNEGIKLAVPGTNGKLSFIRSKSWTYLLLPSGRALVYLNARIEDDGGITFLGKDQSTSKFKRIQTYGGRLSENVASGTARDVMFYNLPRIEAAGYKVVLRVHDEVLTEALDTPKYTPEKLSKLMSTAHSWCKTLPLAAAGFETHRYRGH